MTDQELDTLLNARPEADLPVGLRTRTLAAFEDRTYFRRAPRRWLRWSLAAVAAAAFGVAAFDQSEIELGSSTYPLADGRVLIARTIGRPGIRATGLWSLLTGTSGMRQGYLEQTFKNRFTGERWGYRVASRPADHGQHLLVFSHPEDPRAEAATIPPHTLVKPEQPVEFTLSETLGLHVRLTVSGGPPPTRAGPLDLHLTGPRVYLDGADLGSDGIETVAGRTIQIARRGHGRFTLSFAAESDPRFLAAGTARDRRIEWQQNRHTWRIECTEPVTPTPRTVYIHHEPGYRTAASLEFGAGGRVEEP